MDWKQSWDDAAVGGESFEWLGQPFLFGVCRHAAEALGHICGLLLGQGFGGQDRSRNHQGEEGPASEVNVIKGMRASFVDAVIMMIRHQLQFAQLHSYSPLWMRSKVIRLGRYGSRVQ